MMENYSDRHYSDLQVDPNASNSTHPSREPKYTHAHSDKIVTADELFSKETDPLSHQRRICGLTTRAFWIVTAVVTIIIVAAAVGGGVGGSIASRKSTANDHTNSQSITSSSTASSPSMMSTPVISPSSGAAGTPTISIKTATTIGPSQTLLVDCPSSNFTLYTPPSSSQMFRKVCSKTFIGVNTFNYVNQITSSLDECINLCAAYNVQNATQIAGGSTGICNAVCWRSTIQGDDWPGQCYGFTTTNSSGTFAYNNDVRCSGATLINQAFL